nr:DUF3263 domain-containing protein [Microbacterium bovistercoris]
MTGPLPDRPTVPELLDFEAGHRRHTGTKEQEIRLKLQITPARYYQLLHRAITTETALQHDPILTNRLRDADRLRG